MEDFPQEPSSAYHQQPATPAPVSPVYFGTALAIAFAIGLFIGLTGRPLVIRDVPVQVVVTVVPNQNEQAVAQASAGDSGANQTTVDEAQAAADGTATPTLMEFVMSDARHIQGDPNAPITVVEYSDFK
ncbi:MAG: hypothetical protein KDI79_08430 [Anaerolineae bacterium]|nr:hypothetical protein [Anaerolineae bacterium]